MKSYLKMKQFATILVLALFIFSCSDDDYDGPVTGPADPMAEEPMPDIAETAIATVNLSSLVAALTRAELVATVQGDGPFTVFAPTNDAFATFLSDNGFATLRGCTCRAFNPSTTKPCSGW